MNAQQPDPGGGPLNIRYDPLKPWGGLRGSPCADQDLQARLAFYQVIDPRFRAPAFVSAEDLVNCRECPMCAGCLTHNDCLTDLDHIEWFAQFASPGEPPCNDEGTVAGRQFTCDLRLRHPGPLHMCRRGYRWGTRGAGIPDAGASGRPRAAPKDLP